MDNAITRRGALAAVGGSGLLLGLAACSAEPGGGHDGADADAPAPAATPLSVPASAVPVGGAVIVHVDTIYPVVVAQPTAGSFTAHSAVCTHQGCLVAVAAAVTGTGVELDCPCHGSRFDAATGAVIASPARRPLAAWPFTQHGDAIVLQGRAD